MPTKKSPKKIARSAKSGKIVSKQFAKDNPDTTVVEKIGNNISAGEAEGILRQIDLAMGWLCSVQAFLRTRAKKKPTKNGK